MGIVGQIAAGYNKLFRPLKKFEVKLQIVTPQKALVEVKIVESARSKKLAEQQAIESLKKMIGVVVVDSHQVKK